MKKCNANPTPRSDGLMILEIAWGRERPRPVLMRPDGSAAPADAARPLDERLRDLYPESAWRSVWCIRGAEIPRLAAAAANVCRVLLRTNVQRQQIFWTRPELASVALYTAVERIAGVIWAKQAQNAAESCDRMGPRPDRTLRASVVEIALRVASALRPSKFK